MFWGFIFSFHKHEISVKNLRNIYWKLLKKDLRSTKTNCVWEEDLGMLQLFLKGLMATSVTKGRIQIFAQNI
jgi:hypothetical protein